MEMQQFSVSEFVYRAGSQVHLRDVLVVRFEGVTYNKDEKMTIYSWKNLPAKFVTLRLIIWECLFSNPDRSLKVKILSKSLKTHPNPNNNLNAMYFKSFDDFYERMEEFLRRDPFRVRAWANWLSLD